MSAPIEQFSSLSLEPQMPFSSNTLDSRKIEVRDILSSFNRKILPSEFKPDVYSRIDRNQQLRPSTEWTIPEDLEGTLMQWGVHDENCWNFLRKCQPPQNRARLMHEKLARRFDEQFTAYDHLPSVVRRDETIELSSTTQIRQEVRRIGQNIREIVTAACRDHRERRTGEDGTARQLVRALNIVCKRYEDLSHVRRSGRRPTAGGEPEISLYNYLIQDPPHNHSPFMLDTLERFSSGTLKELIRELREIAGQLLAHQAPTSYQQKMSGILVKATSADPQEESQTGTKRSAEDSAGRRGRRKTGR